MDELRYLVIGAGGMALGGLAAYMTSKVLAQVISPRSDVAMWLCLAAFVFVCCGFIAIAI